MDDGKTVPDSWMLARAKKLAGVEEETRND